MSAFRTLKMHVLVGYLAIGLLSGTASADTGTSKAFVGIGPLFSSSALGYLSGGADFRVARWGDFSLSAGPMIGLFFGSGIIGGDLDGMLKGYYHFQLSSKLSLGITAKLPVGLTLAGVSSLGFGNHFYPGFNIGLIPGVEFYFHQKFGVYGEIGFLHHSLFPKAQYLVSSHISKGIFSLGAILKF